jgi:hypothetical protein
MPSATTLSTGCRVEGAHCHPARSPRKNAPGTAHRAVLDQFAHEVDFDEASHSWHPKAAPVRMLSVDGEIGWPLWIGSRNQEI